ncbi:MAG: hypothetical protein J3R72DRAFT_474241 [Linnemannia gamsii]|nr:MAG: hypothetical protein J3R72DRAFT_474241 [Linnemannia gamsii]
MKIAALTLGFALVAVAAAQAADPMAANGAQTTYEWAQPADQADLIVQLEEAYNQISGLEFRSLFISRLEPQPPQAVEGEEFNAEFICKNGFKVIKNAITAVIKKIAGIDLPGLLPIKTILDTINQNLSQAADNAGEGNIQLSFMSLDMVTTALTGVNAMTMGAFSPMMEELEKIKKGLAQLAICSLSTQSVASMDKATCYEIADLYRAIVADVIAGTPALPADASEDLQRYSAGTQAILQIISKNSIAANNDALLDSRPIFAADLLEDYRTEMLRAGAKDSIQKYAAGSLGLVVASSNALEACLRVAANPASAVEELNDELDALEDEDEADEDEDEADEDDEPEADEAVPQAEAAPQAPAA